MKNRQSLISLRPISVWVPLILPIAQYVLDPEAHHHWKKHLKLKWGGKSWKQRWRKKVKKKKKNERVPVKLESLVMGESFAHWTIVWRDTVEIFGNSIVSSDVLAATRSLAKASQVSSSDLTKTIFFRFNFLVPFLFNWSLRVFQSVIRQFLKKKKKW